MRDCTQNVMWYVRVKRWKASVIEGELFSEFDLELYISVKWKSELAQFNDIVLHNVRLFLEKISYIKLSLYIFKWGSNWSWNLVIET